MVFPVVLYRCKSSTIKQAVAEERLSSYGAGEDSWESLEQQGSNELIPKKIILAYSLEGLMLKLQYSGYLMRRADSLEKTLMLGNIEGKRRKGKQKLRWLDSITDSMEMNLNKLWEIENRGAWRAIVHGVTKSWTQLSNWTTTMKRPSLGLSPEELHHWMASKKRRSL